MAKTKKNPRILEECEDFLWSEWRDLNPRPLGPEPSALPTALHPDISLKYLQNRMGEKKSGRAVARPLYLEAPPRFELGHQDFADPCLTTWLWRHTLLFYCAPQQIRTTREKLSSTSFTAWKTRKTMHCEGEGKGNGMKESRLKGGVPEWGDSTPTWSE